MKATKTLMVAALAAAGLAMTGMAQAQAKHGYRGGGGYYHGGGYYRPWGGRYWGPGLGLAIGVPLGIGLSSWGWGYPHYYDSPRVVYREVIRDRDPGYIGRIHPMPLEQPAGAAPQPRTEGAPASPPLYMNYCESSKAYYPKVTSCPEGWRFQQPN